MIDVVTFVFGLAWLAWLLYAGWHSSPESALGRWMLRPRGLSAVRLGIEVRDEDRKGRRSILLGASLVISSVGMAGLIPGNLPFLVRALVALPLVSIGVWWIVAGTRRMSSAPASPDSISLGLTHQKKGDG